MYYNEKDSIKVLSQTLYGIQDEKKLIIDAIKRKAQKAKECYLKKINNIELAIRLFDILTSESLKKIPDWIKETEEAKVFSHIYILGNKFILDYDTYKESFEMKQMDKQTYERLQKIGRMTAEKIIKFEDEEWS
ncbi:MAG: hypothetical protein IKU06_05725 [Lachnospiraceae bacterium]|nr:hypothetical protein [Lachnospiraceae bacterium]